MAILIATVMTFTILQKNNELTAIKSAGISIYRLTIPFILIGLLSSIFTFYFENLFVTQSVTLKSYGTYPVTYMVDDRVELLSEPKWLQDWDPIYPELNMKSN